MTRLLAISTLAAALSLGAAANANAWTRNATIHGPRGMSTVHAQGSCAYGTCNRSVTRTGPYGNTYTHSGSVTCASGTCNGSATTTGPYGGSVTRYGTVTRY